MDRETRERLAKIDCVFFPRKRKSQAGGVCCLDKTRCAVCGWNPEVQAARIEKIRERMKNGE